MRNRLKELSNCPGTSHSPSIQVRAAIAASARIGKWLLPLFLMGCAAYSGTGLKPGSSSLEEVIAVMGPPALQWTNTDRSVQLSYPRGPAGPHSYMAYVDAGGRLERIENVMAEASFARVKADITTEDVLRILGPSVPSWSVFYPSRRELVWEWRYCDYRGMFARFVVLFDSDIGRVRSTQSIEERCPGFSCLCGN